MSFALKSCPITSSNVALNDLHDKLNNTIKNKLYNINNQEMDNSTCSTCADSSDLNNLDSDNLDSHLNNLGLMFYKNMDYKQKNKYYNFNVYAVADLEKFYTNALYNGWLLTSDGKYSCNSLDIRPCCWLDLESILTKQL